MSELRGKVASEMREHSDEYLPFITTASGDLLDAKGFEDYCDKLENTPEWGGQPEVRSHISNTILLNCSFGLMNGFHNVGSYYGQLYTVTILNILQGRSVP